MWSPLTPLSLIPVDRVLEHLSNLSREVNLDFERSMNKINFDQIVSSKPDTFSYVTLPKKEEEEVPEQGEGVGKGGPRATHPARAPPTSPSRIFYKAHSPVPVPFPAFTPSFPNCLEGWGGGGVDEGSS